MGISPARLWGFLKEGKMSKTATETELQLIRDLGVAIEPKAEWLIEKLNNILVWTAPECRPLKISAALLEIFESPLGNGHECGSCDRAVTDE
jgi:hypothetical protein